MKKRMRSSKGIAMGVRPMANALVLIVEPHDDDDEQYVARFVENNEPLISYIPAVMLNLIGYMAGCKLLEQGHDPEKQIRVRLAGSDHDLLNCTLGVAAAQPIPNYAAPG